MMVDGLKRFSTKLFVCSALLLCSTSILGQGQTSIPPHLLSGLKWRLIGPFRGGRALAVTGVRDQPYVFYFGAVGGGIWKTTDGGEVWNPIFDGQPIASIGALAVAPSDSNVIYAGTGEADMRSDISFGNGMYKSTDAGKTWRHLGLDDTRQIGRILVDGHNPDFVVVAALGHGFGPNAMRGVFRSTDGGKTWQKVLYKDENTGAIDLASDVDAPEAVGGPEPIYAAMWNTRRPPWSVYAPLNGPGGGLYKSTDDGTTWKELLGHGLPAGQMGRIGVAVAPGHRGRIVYALIDAEHGTGLYRSDDAGATWRLVSADQRIDSRPWYFSGVTVDPKDPEIVYVSNVSIYRSTDGGKSFQTIKGAPGGDDYHSLWIDPENTQRMILGSDQGVAISVDGARTWTSWYNQPTAQFYHVAVDNGFPYFVYGAQQDSGTAAVASRSDYGQITFRDWYPIGAGESGYILPDPIDSDIVYGGSTGGELYRFSRRTGQVQDITPTPGSPGESRPRYPWTAALAISPLAPHALYQGAQFMMASTDRGMSWTKISGDLTVKSGASDDGKAVIYCIAPSPIDTAQIWVGTDNGSIQLTRDGGKTWRNVTPPGLPPWSMISVIDASHLDAGTAYVAIDRHQMDDVNPYIYRTHDFGKTWTKITSGISEPAYVHAVREDPVRKGLLFAGTEIGVYVSFDDGAQWQPLNQNLPVTPIRDLVIKDTDLVAATHGRSFWILDDITPLRQVNPGILLEAAHLFNPAEAIRLRKSENRDTPLPPETPAGTNPPTGATIDYVLKSEPAGDVTLEILDGAGHLASRFSSADEPRKIEDVQSFPTFWQRPEDSLPRHAGMNRFVWHLRYTRPPALRYEYGMAVGRGEDTPRLPEGVMAPPGVYQVRLTVDGRSYTAPLTVKMDPRVAVAPDALARQLDLELKIEDAMSRSYRAVLEIRDLRRQVNELQTRLSAIDDRGQTSQSAAALERKASQLADGPPGGRDVWPPPAEGALRLERLNAGLAALLTAVESPDAAPTAQQAAAFTGYSQAVERQISKWEELKSKDLAELNVMLRKQRLPEIVPANRDEGRNH
jgi:photosystem II stability/assembly factor-like uncharacterized protein